MYDPSDVETFARRAIEGMTEATLDTYRDLGESIPMDLTDEVREAALVYADDMIRWMLQEVRARIIATKFTAAADVTLQIER